MNHVANGTNRAEAAVIWRDAVLNGGTALATKLNGGGQ